MAEGNEHNRGTTRPPTANALGFELLISSETHLFTVKLLPGESYVIGRAHGVDIRVRDASVSRQHARLTIKKDVVELEDLRSSNGTRIGGTSLSPEHVVPFPIGSVAEVGSATLLLQHARGRSTKQHGLGGAPVFQAPPMPSAATAPAPAPRIVIDPKMLELYSMLDLVAPTTLSVLILGETGVGKEVFAQEVHARSQRANEPFLQLNSAALPESTLEAELFGFEKGAFTGAVNAKAGLFESADRGTVFLDEIGDMPLATQVKILRVLETGHVFRLGSVKPRKVDVRILSATNRDLPALIAEGAYRSDLYFRLNGITFTIPPLRERRSEIVPLAAMFAAIAAKRLKRPEPRLSPAVVGVLTERPWPGNVRELRNVIERAVVLSGVGDASELRLEHIPPDALVIPPPRRAEKDTGSFLDSLGERETGRFAVVPSMSAPTGGDLTETPMSKLTASGHGSMNLTTELREIECQRIRDALQACHGNQSQAARQLGISRAVLMNRMKVFGLTRPREEAGPPMAAGGRTGENES